MRRFRIVKRVVIVAGGLFAGSVLVQPESRASMFGEENLTLANILVQTTHSASELKSIAKTAEDTANIAEGILETYQAVNAGIEALRTYSTEDFLHDFKQDVYHLYPGFAKLEYASGRLTHWDETYSQSPWTAYEAMSATAADLTGPLRDDLKAGRVNIDNALILRGEAAGGFAAAATAEQATKTYDRELRELRARYAANPDPGTAAMIGAHTNLILAEQNSHIIRLLSRSVRLDGVDKALNADERIRGLNASYERRDATGQFAEEAIQPPRMMQFAAPGDAP